jgi:hypothetical protein
VRPNIAAAFYLLLERTILLLGVNERPNLIALNVFARQIAKRFVLILRAGAAKIAEQLNDSILGNAGHSDGCADAVSLDQTGNDSRAFIGTQLIHGGHYA